MKECPIDRKRTVSLVGQHGAGKTMLMEALLYNVGVIPRMGSTDAGNTFCDYHEEERQRKISIHAALVHLDCRDHSLFLIDTPGYADFIGDIKSAMAATDSSILLLNAASGVEVETLRVFEFAREYNSPLLAVINVLDKERADFYEALRSMQRELSGMESVALTLPIGKESGLRGVVDLVTRKALRFDEKGNVAAQEAVPADMDDLVDKHREKLMDAAANASDELTEKYLTNGTLNEYELRNGLRLAIAGRQIIPVLAASGEKRIGISTVLDAIIDLLPAPSLRGKITGHLPGKPESEVSLPVEGESLCAQVYQVIIDPFAGRQAYVRVFAGVLHSESTVLNASTGNNVRIANLGLISGGTKPPVLPRATAGDIVGILKVEGVVAGQTLCDAARPIELPPIQFPKPVIMMAIHAVDRKDEEKLGTTLPRVVEVDRCLSLRREPDTHELLLEGQGEMQLNIAVETLKNLGVNVTLAVPKVPYKETITAKGEGMYRHKKQTGGRGQFGEVHMRFEPLTNGEHFAFVDAIVGGVIPGRFIPAVEKGVVERMARGALAGYPLTGIQATVFFGKAHDVDSDEMSFKTAASICTRNVIIEKCKPVLLEPIYDVIITVPDEYLGDVMGDLNARRGRVMGMEGTGGKQQIKAQVPLAELFRYSIELRALTRGRGMFEMTFSRYDVVPRDLAEKIIAAAGKQEDED